MSGPGFPQCEWRNGWHSKSGKSFQRVCHAWRVLMVIMMTVSTSLANPGPEGQGTDPAPERDVVELASPESSPSTAPRLSMQFHALDIRAALAVIAEFAGVNIVTSDAVSGHITLRLQDVAWPVALETILRAKGLGQRRQDGVIWVATRAEITARERQDHEHRAALHQLEPVQTRSFQLNYAKAVDVVAHLLSPSAGGAWGGMGGASSWGTPWAMGSGSGMGAAGWTSGWGGGASANPAWAASPAGVSGHAPALSPGADAAGAMAGLAGGPSGMSLTAPWGMGSGRSLSHGAAFSHGHPRFLSPRGVALAEPRTNQLFVTDVPSRLDAVQRMLAQVDVPLRQVMIEARIVEAGDSFARSLGAKLATVDMAGQRSQAGNSLPTVTANTPLMGQADKTPDMSGQILNLPAASLAGQDPGTLAYSFFNAARTRLLAVELSALETEGQGRVVSNPRVVTADQVKAVIEQGTELPYQATTTSGAHSISFRKANLRLEVTPQITPEGGIILEVDLSKDSVGQMTPAGFAIDTKHLSTQVLVDDGGTVVIGGIYETSDTGQDARVPWLGRLPLIGALFGNQQLKRQKQELLVFLTPKMLPQRASAP
ncbi:MAG: type IV pilus secretin PilQ [Limnohabitans sp.]|nr:type IV pilus secretin PilQ [Limnohabitans sp.]